MPERKMAKSKTEAVNDNPQLPKQIQRANIFARTNRGMLLDAVVFLINLFLMRLLAERFVALVKDASDGDTIAGFAMFLFCLGIFVLAPVGATLKRWHFHRRLQMQGKTVLSGENFLSGCLFNPIFYFCLNLIIISAINAFTFQLIYGNKEPGGAVFVSTTLFGLVLTIVQTVLIYRYFSPPKHEPATAYLRSPQSERLGDVCIFTNMILFQLLWNVLTMSVPPRPANVSVFAEIGFRLFFLGFAALLIYFPPRIFYLAEDIHRRRAWLTILLANSPVLFRVIFGSTSSG